MENKKYLDWKGWKVEDHRALLPLRPVDPPPSGTLSLIPGLLDTRGIADLGLCTFRRQAGM